MAKTPFSSNSLSAHLLRGLVGIAAVIYAIKLGSTHALGSVALAAVAVVAFRGCPGCWITGLIEALCDMWKGRDPAKAHIR